MGSSLALLAKQASSLADPLPCAREDWELWFSDRPAELRLAKAYCRPCPVRRACLAGAVERGEPYGVWGGEIFDHGAVIAEKKPRGRPPKAAAQDAGQAGAEIRRSSPQTPRGKETLNRRCAG